MHLWFFVTETCKFDALDKRLKSGDVFDQTHEKNLIIYCSYCGIIVLLPTMQKPGFSAKLSFCNLQLLPRPIPFCSGLHPQILQRTSCN